MMRAKAPGATDPPGMVRIHPLRPSRRAAARAVTRRDTGHRSIRRDTILRRSLAEVRILPVALLDFSGRSSVAERAVGIREAAGAIPVAQTHESLPVFTRCSSAGEHLPWEQGVGGANPLT